MPTKARAAWIGLLLALLLVAAAFTVPRWLEWEVWPRAPRSTWSHEVPPLHGRWQPTWFGPGTVPALVWAVLAVRFGPRLAARLTWGRLLLAGYAAGVVWMLSLALVDGTEGISRVLGGEYDYLPSAREVGDVPGLLRGYVDRIPLDSPDAWPTHPAGHPPLALLFFVALVRLGLGGSFAAGLVVTLIAASLAVAVLVALRALGAEAAARRVAPFLVLSPAAVFLAVSADAVYAVVGAWGLACLALGATARDRGRGTGALLGWSAAGGLLLGGAVMMSYGLPLLGIIALAVIAAARTWTPLPLAAAAAAAVVLGFATAGFVWWEAYPVLVDRYWDGIAADRPASYWWWGNLAALLVSTGPLLGAGLAASLVGVRGADRGERVVRWLVAAAVVCVALADASGMSKSEVERIWLPFVPWLTLSVALLPDRWLRWGLALQLGWALVVQHLLYTSW